MYPGVAIQRTVVALEYLAVSTTIAAIDGYGVHITQLYNLALSGWVFAHNLAYSIVCVGWHGVAAIYHIVANRGIAPICY